VTKLIGACLREDPPAAELLLQEVDGGVDAALDILNNLARPAPRPRRRGRQPRRCAVAGEERRQ
jgi:hypothetical protein